MVDFRHSAAQVALAAVVGAGGRRRAASALFRRYPQAFPIAAVAVLPLRVPLEIGGETANLLVPLYAGDRRRRDRRGARRAAGAAAGRAGDPWSQRLRWVLAATLVLYAIQASYSEDVSNAIENIGFFLVPFAVLFACSPSSSGSRAAAPHADRGRRSSPWRARWSAIYQYFARDLFLNPELFDANELHVYFRVNSIFFDPNIFGRYLALALTALAACIAWGGERRELAPLAAVFALGLVALAFSYSLTELRRAARRPRHRRGAALGLARARSPSPASAPSRWSRC